ncbi:MAG: hypothetical protein NVS4B1_28260 [Ktedonobacteraceae bacterium]
MKYKTYLRVGWVVLPILLTILVLILTILPAHAATRHTYTQKDTTPLGATIYLTNGTLAPIFQSRVNQQVPGVVSAAITSIVSKLPAADQGWASTMATTVIQPSVLLTSLMPTQGGLVAAIRISLYAGDPQPISARLLIKFSILDSSTVQVSAQPMPGSPSLINGPITTLHIPIGQLNSINATPGCGDSTLAVNLQVPVSLGGQTTSIQGEQIVSNSIGVMRQQHTQMLSSMASGGTTYVEVSSASLAALGSSLGSFPIGNNNMSAQNIQVSVQGSNIIVTSDIILGSSFKLGTAVTTVQPTAVGGNLAVNVLSTTLTVLQVFTFPQDTYNAQIQQMLNAKLGTALRGKFNISNAAIGTNSHVPCTASDSLVLTGTTNLV